MTKTPCEFVGGGPWDGEKKLVSDKWEDVRIARAPTIVDKDIKTGAPLIAIPNYAYYVRSDVSPHKFIFEPNMPPDEDDTSGSL